MRASSSTPARWRWLARQLSGSRGERAGIKHRIVYAYLEPVRVGQVRLSYICVVIFLAYRLEVASSTDDGCAGFARSNVGSGGHVVMYVTIVTPERVQATPLAGWKNGDRWRLKRAQPGAHSGISLPGDRLARDLLPAVRLAGISPAGRLAVPRRPSPYPVPGRDRRLAQPSCPRRGVPQVPVLGDDRG
jgi:hypothetical protein